MLNELVMDLDVLPIRGSPSTDSSSSAELTSAQSSICTPSTQQMMSFSPPKSKSGLLATRTMDASQRTPACARGIGSATVSGDASQRNPIAKVPLGVAVVGGDASQRSPPGCTSLSQMRPVPTPMQGNYVAKSVGDLIVPVSAPDTVLPAPSSGTITGTSPAGQVPRTQQDASQRSLPVQRPADLSKPDCHGAMRAWLLGVDQNVAPVSTDDLVERLYAAAPEVYED